jgi:hypothetical protein
VLVAALALGLDRSVGLVAFVFGAGILLVSALADPRRRFLAPEQEPLPAPPDARYESKAELARAAIFPSTVGVTVLAAAALAFDLTLGAVLAGAVAGMGLAALVSAARIAEQERREGVRFYVGRGGGRRLYARPRG